VTGTHHPVIADNRAFVTIPAAHCWRFSFFSASKSSIFFIYLGTPHLAHHNPDNIRPHVLLLASSSGDSFLIFAKLCIATFRASGQYILPISSIHFSKFEVGASRSFMSLNNQKLSSPISRVTATLTRHFIAAALVASCICPTVTSLLNTHISPKLNHFECVCKLLKSPVRAGISLLKRASCPAEAAIIPFLSKFSCFFISCFSLNF
jgi:hypothetical protein